MTDKTGNNRKNGKEVQFFTLLFIKAEVRDEHKHQLVSSFKGENKQCLEFQSKFYFFMCFHIIMVKYTRVEEVQSIDSIV